MSKNLPDTQCFALESFVVFLESVANFFSPKQQVFGKFVWSLEKTLMLTFAPSKLRTHLFSHGNTLLLAQPSAQFFLIS